MAKIMKDGKPSTSFSRQDREWVKSMRGGDTPTGTITITENGEYDVTDYATADVQVAGGSSDFTVATVTLNLTYPEGVTVVSESTGAYTINVSENMGETISSQKIVSTNHEIKVLVYDDVPTELAWASFEADDADLNYFIADAGAEPTCTGDITYNSATGNFSISGNGTISGTMTEDE